MTELSDELLVAYVDGQLARKQTSAVEKVLKQDDIIARRVDALKEAHSRLEAAFDAILAGEEIDVSAKSGPERPGIFVSWATAAKLGLASAGILVAMGLLIAGYGWPLALPGATSPQPNAVAVVPNWQEEAARAQALLSRTSLEVGTGGAINRGLVAFQLAQAIGGALKFPDLEEEGLRFMRGQILRSEGQPMTQLLYLGDAGAPLGLYARKGDGSDTLSFARYGAIGAVSWAEKGIAYLLAGEESEERLMALGEIAKRIPAAVPPVPPSASPTVTAR